MGCTGTGDKYAASSPLITTVPFDPLDANELLTIVLDAAGGHHLHCHAQPTMTTVMTAGGVGECAESPMSDAKMAKTANGGDDDDDDEEEEEEDDEALLLPTHFFRPVPGIVRQGEFLHKRHQHPDGLPRFLANDNFGKGRNTRPCQRHGQLRSIGNPEDNCMPLRRLNSELTMVLAFICNK